MLLSVFSLSCLREGKRINVQAWVPGETRRSRLTGSITGGMRHICFYASCHINPKYPRVRMGKSLLRLAWQLFCWVKKNCALCLSNFRFSSFFNSSSNFLRVNLCVPTYTMSSIKLLVANRGEIAIRILTAAAELGFQTVAVYGDDQDKSHCFAAHTSIRLPSSASFLNPQHIVDAAKRCRLWVMAIYHRTCTLTNFCCIDWLSALKRMQFIRVTASCRSPLNLRRNATRRVSYS